MEDQIPAGVRVDEVFLDTTYCLPRHSFPPQQQVIQSLVREVQLLGQPPITDGCRPDAVVNQAPLRLHTATDQEVVAQSLTNHSSTITSPSADHKAAASLGW
eukprot:scaffold209839_cov21-Tisochrysis_lutea.AAC.1